MVSAAHSKSIFQSETAKLILLVFLAFFLPTSIEGEQIEAIWGAINAVLIGVVCLQLASQHGFNRFVTIAAIAVLVALCVSSLIVLIGKAGDFSTARFAPTFIVLAVFSLRTGSVRIRRETAIRLIDILALVIIAWNLLALVRFEPLISFVEKYYIQLDDYTATEYSLLVGKPVFTFGVHNFASVFYFFIFYCASKIYFQDGYKRMLIYSAALFVFTLLLASTAAYGTAAIMIAAFAYELWYRKTVSIKWLMVLLAPVIIALILLNPATIERLLLSENGFIARYASNNLYAGNSAFLMEYPLGAGFTIPSSSKVYFADSGFWIYLTMGNVSLLCGLFALFFFYVKKNVHEKDDRIYLIVSYLTAELSFSSFLYWKTIALLIISVVILNALSKKKKSKKDSSLSANRG